MNKGLNLPPQVIEVLLAIAGSLGDTGRALSMQAHHARVTAYSPTYIDLNVPIDCELGVWEDGPLGIKPLVTDQDGEAVGEILVWVSAGRMTLLEQAWFTDDPPTAWPPLESVSIP